MAFALFAKSAVGTNLGFLKTLNLQLKSFKDVVRQTLWKRVQVQPSKFGKAPNVSARDRCLVHQSKLTKTTEAFQSHVFKSLFSRTASYTWAREARRRVASRLSSSTVKSFRNLPLISLIGVSLGVDADKIIDNNTEQIVEDMKNLFSDYGWKAKALNNPPKSLKDLDMSLTTLASGCEGAVYKAKIKDSSETNAPKEVDNFENDDAFDLAVKAVFNYGAASNAESILRELRREYVPLHMAGLENDHVLSERVGRLPPHPNIVDMPGIFEDDVLVTEEALQKFPAALPHRINPRMCYGRNKTLYVVMRRRSTHLRDYLSTHEVSMETRCFLLLQLLEGICHLEQHGIAHRDLKADNLLVDIPKNGGPPKLEICDFGCCLAEENRSLQVSHLCEDVYKGGNSWLMAPEIATSVPGPGNVLDYRKSDVWAAGAIAYEILGGENPFYPSRTGDRRQMSSRSYCEDDLPALPEEVPEAVQWLVFAMLARQPSERPTAATAATVMHIALNDLDNEVPEVRERSSSHRPVPELVARAQQERVMFQSVLSQSLTLMCQLTLGSDKERSGWDVRDVMRFLFLSRLTYKDFKEAVAFF